MPDSLPMWVSELHCRPEICAKLIREHHLTFEDVRAALVGQPGLWFRAVQRNGEVRWEGFVDIAGKRTFVVIAPHAYLMDEYWLVTSYRKTM